MNLQTIRTFLERILPWGKEDTFVNIHWTFQRAGYNKPAWGGRACTSMAEALDSISYASRQPDTKDIYVCVSTQKECVMRERKGGGGFWRQAVRNQQNVDEIRVFYMDVDVSNGHASDKNYGSQADAARALAGFVRAAGLPAPNALVSTGSGGLHVYWTLETPITLDVWQPLAGALAEATRRFGFHCDTAVTVDSARVMRVPETKHSKHGTVAQLLYMSPQDTTLAKMTQALAPYMGAQVIALPLRGKPLDGNDELSAGISREGPPINLKSVADAGCGFIANALANGGKDYANPLWNLTTLVAVFTEGGRADAHAMASGHATYTPEDTDALFDRKTRERAEKNLGWPSCQSVENAGCSSCAGCPIRTPDSRPLQFGRPSASAAPQGSGTPALDDMPDRYHRDPRTNKVYKLTVNPKNGKTSFDDVCSYGLINPWVQKNPWMLHFTVLLGHRPQQVSASVKQLNSTEAFASVVGEAGVGLSDEHRKLLREFAVAWMSKLQSIKDAVVTASPYGWLVNPDSGKVEGFCYGGKVWSPKGSRPSGAPPADLGATYTPRGKLDPWLKASQTVASWKSPAHDMILATSFAAPLVKFVGQSGMLVSTYSIGSAKGKTTTLKIAQGVWGHPVVMQGLADTSVSVLNKMGNLRNLPMFWDELKSEAQRQSFVTTLFSLTAGREKTRLTVDATQRVPGTWQTLLASASNDSILDNVIKVTKSTTAGVLRVYEVKVPPAPVTLSSSDVDDIVNPINDNYGHAGLAYAKFLGENHEKVSEQVIGVRKWLEEKLKSPPEERFWVATIAVIYVGARFANHLKLTQIDEKALLQFMLDGIRSMRKALLDSPVDLSKELPIADILSDYLSEQRARHTLVTDHIHTRQGKPPAGSVKILLPTDKLDAVRVQIGRDTGQMRIGSTHFREWLDAKDFSTTSVVDMLKSQFGMKSIHGRMGSGTDFVGGLQYLLEFNLNHPTMQTIIEL